MVDPGKWINCGIVILWETECMSATLRMDDISGMLVNVNNCLEMKAWFVEIAGFHDINII